MSGGGASFDRLGSAVADGAGGVVVTGTYSDTATFAGVAYADAGATKDTMLWRIDANATSQWFARVRGNSKEAMHAVARQDNGTNFVGGGYFSATSTFGYDSSNPARGVTLTATAEWDAVLWKVSTLGTTMWAVKGGGGLNTDFNFLRAVAAAPVTANGGAGGGATGGGEAAVVGVGRIALSTVTFGGVVLVGDGVIQGELVMWNVDATSGATKWAVRAGGSSPSSGSSSGGDLLLAVAWGADYGGGGAGFSAAASDGALASVGGHFTAAGHFYDTAVFGGVSVTSPGDSGGVVWRVSGEGTTLWAVSGGGPGKDNLHAAAAVSRVVYPIDPGASCASCDVVVGGSFTERATFGGVSLLGRGTVIDAVLWRISSLGTTQWAVHGGGTSFDRVYAVAHDGGGGVIAAGYFTNTATFGDVVLRGAGDRDALLWWGVQISSTPPLPPSTSTQIHLTHALGVESGLILNIKPLKRDVAIW
jgi:hypothetical protein